MTGIGMMFAAIAPLLSGFNPDPTICRVGKDYYIVTSSFELSPGLPVYHSTDLTNWTVVAHAWTEKRPCRTVDDGLWAPTLRHRDGTFYITVTWHGGKGNPENYLLSAKDPKGPWSKPVFVESSGGIDPSLFFDDDGTAWYMANRPARPQKWKAHCEVWMQRIDVAAGRLFGDRLALASGVGKDPRYAEGPHLYKIDGRYVLVLAQGGTEYGHGVAVYTADRVEGPYAPVADHPLLTAVDWGEKSPFQAFGHADLFDTPDGRRYAVFLGKRVKDGVCALGRETFMCPVDVGEGARTFAFRREECVAGSWTDPTRTRYSLLNRPDDKTRYVKARSAEDPIVYPVEEYKFSGAMCRAAD